MRVDPLLALRFHAWRAGVAMRAFTHQRILLQPHALFVSAVQFPGEDNTIFAAAVGHRAHRAPLRVFGTPDPRLREEASVVIARMHALLERYLQRCERVAVAPQLVLTSPAALRHLQHIADDLRFGNVNPTLAALATTLSYFTMRADVADQQAVVRMTDVLRTHWVPALDPTQCEHLGALVAAIDPPPGMTVADAIARAEQFPMGARTTPSFDRDLLQPALAAFHTARRRHASESELAAHGHHVVAVIAPVVTTMYETLHHAANVLEGAQLPYLPQIDAWIAAERDAFRDFRAATARGIRTPRMDQAKGGVFRYAEREQALTSVESAVECHDDFGRACGVARGAMIEGVVTAVRRTQVPGHTRRALLVDVVTTQTALRIREGHELVDRAEHRARFLVRSVRATGVPGAAQTTLELQMVGGSRVPGPPQRGVPLTLVREVPDLRRIGRLRGALASKLAMPHWTMGGPLPADRPPRRAPGLPADLPTSPLRALEALR